MISQSSDGVQSQGHDVDLGFEADVFPDPSVDSDSEDDADARESSKSSSYRMGGEARLSQATVGQSSRMPSKSRVSFANLLGRPNRDSLAEEDEEELMQRHSSHSNISSRSP